MAPEKPLDKKGAASSFGSMKREFSEIAEEVLSLPKSEQLRLVRTLLEQVEGFGEIGGEDAWEEEIQRRIEKIDSGLGKGRAFAEVLQEVDSQLGR